MHLQIDHGPLIEQVAFTRVAPDASREVGEGVVPILESGVGGAALHLAGVGIGSSVQSAGEFRNRLLVLLLIHEQAAAAQVGLGICGIKLGGAVEVRNGASEL